jgi:hypothetical protein
MVIMDPPVSIPPRQKQKALSHHKRQGWEIFSPSFTGEGQLLNFSKSISMLTEVYSNAQQSQGILFLTSSRVTPDATIWLKMLDCMTQAAGYW